MKIPALLCTVVAVMAITAAGAGATPSEPVTITVQTVEAATGEASGPFTAAGPICPSGVTYTESRDTSGFERGFGGQIRVTKLFVCDDGSGSFELKLNVAIRFGPFSDTYNWVVVDGTGAYADLRGTGSGTGTPAGDVLLDEYAGSMHID